jgi:hypothetical protein
MIVPLKTRVQGADGCTHMVVTGACRGRHDAYTTDVYRARDPDDTLDNATVRWSDRTEAYFDYKGTHDPLLASVVHWWVVERLGIDSDWLHSVLKAGSDRTFITGARRAGVLDARALQRQAAGIMTWRDHTTREQKEETTP